MKRVLGSIVFFFLILIFLCQPVVAKEQETIIIGKDEIVSSDLVKYGSSLLISGKVDGDCFLAGGLVNFDGIVTGDLMIAGGKVNVNGQVNGNLRVVGGDINIGGKIGKNITIIGGTARVENITVPGSMTVLAANLENKANIGGGGKIAVSRALLDGSFGKDLKLSIDKELIIGPYFSSSGSFVYGGSESIKVDKNAKLVSHAVFDKTIKIIPESYSKTFKQNDFSVLGRKVRTATTSISFIFSLIVGFILLKLIPQKSQRLVQLMEQKIIPSFGWGLLIVIISFFLVVFLFASIIGIPLALLYLLILSIMIFLAKIIGSLTIGRRLLLSVKLGERRGWALMIGLIIYYLVAQIQIIGIVYKALVLTCALGVFVLYYKNREALDRVNKVKITVKRKKKSRRKNKKT